MDLVGTDSALFRAWLLVLHMMLRLGGTARRPALKNLQSLELYGTAVTDDGTRHQLWALTDPAEHAAVAADLAARTALIADGHHRYAAYLKLRDQERGAGRGDGPWDYGLAFLVDSAAYPPRIGAIHRVIPGLTPGRAAEMAKGAMRVERLEPVAAPEVSTGSSLGRAVTALAEAGRHGPAFLLTDGSEHYLLTGPAPDRVARPPRPASCLP